MNARILPLRTNHPVWLAIALLMTTAGPGWAQHTYPITSGQRSIATQVAQAGVPLAELAPNAPERYTIRQGDTLWGISAMYLNKPWRWPELWGLNLQQIRNPHLIFPGQVLLLTKLGDRAFLTLDTSTALPTVKLTPQMRVETLDNDAIEAIPAAIIEPFLRDSLLVDAHTHTNAPRIVAAQDSRVLLSKGDRAYARGLYGDPGGKAGTPLLLGQDQTQSFGIYRHAVALRDPQTQALLGHEAQFIGQARLVRGESVVSANPPTGRPEVVPATIDITVSKEEIRIGDRLLPHALHERPRFFPRAPEVAVHGQVIKVHGHDARYAGQHQVLVLNRGRIDGLEPGHVLALRKHSATSIDRTDPSQALMQLPSEHYGVMMVFRTFDKVSYALVMNVTDGAQAGDHFSPP